MYPSNRKNAELPSFQVPNAVNVAELLHTIAGTCTASPSVGKLADAVKRFRHNGGGRTERNYRTQHRITGDGLAEAAPIGISFASNHRTSGQGRVNSWRAVAMRPISQRPVVRGVRRGGRLYPDSVPLVEGGPDRTDVDPRVYNVAARPPVRGAAALDRSVPRDGFR